MTDQNDIDEATDLLMEVLAKWIDDGRDPVAMFYAVADILWAMNEEAKQSRNEEAKQSRRTH